MKKLLYCLTKPSLQPHHVQEIMFTIPRVVCGYLLTTDFGAAKFGLPWSPEDKNLRLFEVAFWFPNDVAQYGGVFAMFPTFLAWMGAFSEAVGGLALLLGFQTRLFSFLIVCTMLTAMFAQQFEAGLWNMLPAMGFLWVGMTHLVLGSGRFGLDYIITQKWKI
jgi:putative oxidoreductase